MRTIAIINQKGGCGKTTTSINLAACLARLGQKTLLLDMDPQGHCAVGLAVPEEQIERTIFEALIEDRDGKPARLSEIVWQIATDFDLGPSDIKLSAFEQLFAGRTGREDRLKKAVATVASTYKWCIIDCPPSVGLLTFNALRACDEVIVPVETGYFSLHGLAKMMETLEVLREKCGNEILIRILPTLYDTRTRLAREVLSELRNRFREYLMESTVNFNTKLKEAASFGQPITEYDPGSRGYKDFLNLARELMGHRPVDAEPTPMDQLSRPAELVQRAKQLAQLTNVQFGRNVVTTPPEAPASGPGDVFADERSPMIERMKPASPSTLAGGSGITFGGSIDGITPPSPKPIDDILASIPPLATGPMSTQGSFNQGNFSDQGLSSLVFPGGSLISESTTITPGRPTMQVSNRMTEINPSAGVALALSSQDEETADGGLRFTPAPLTLSAQPSPATTTISKSTARKIDEFYGVKQIGEEVIFTARFSHAKKVLIAGDFNNWSPMSTPMINRRPGEFWTCLPLRPGRYRYRFVVDGKWMTDPNNSYVETNQFGELNNVIEVD